MALNAKIERLAKKVTKEVSTVEAQKGDKGEQGERGKTGKAGATGKEGKQGISVVDAKIDLDGHLTLKLSDDSEIDAGEIQSETKDNRSVYYSMSGASSADSISGLETYIRTIMEEDSLTTKLIDTDGDYKYIGEAEAGASEASAVWRIKRIEFLSGDDVEIKWLNGSTAYENTWASRTSPSYS